jgi:glycerol-3-phosphate acyltransferase PlsX
VEKMRLAVDVESGDFGCRVTIKGVLDAMESSGSPPQVFLCGNEAAIGRVLAEEGDAAQRFRDSIAIVHCPERIGALDRQRIWAWRHRANASIIRCITLQKEGKVDASVSAGDTAILMSAALFILGRRKGAPRPALAAFLPTMQRKPVLLLDVGANLKCRKEHLAAFAFMGLEYISSMYEKKFPSVALLNVGKEKVKGFTSIRDADKLLRKKCSEYIGFIEGNQVLSGVADVVVCDGFAGNALLKTCESIHLLIAAVIERERPELLKEVQRHTSVLDPENYGAVPFLGIKGIVLKAHGGSSPKAIASAVCAAERSARLNQSKHLWTRTTKGPRQRGTF